MFSSVEICKSIEIFFSHLHFQYFEIKRLKGICRKTQVVPDLIHQGQIQGISDNLYSLSGKLSGNYFAVTYFMTVGNGNTGNYLFLSLSLTLSPPQIGTPL